jgi:hypothetical protein
LYSNKFSNKSLFKEFIGNHNIQMRVLALLYNIAEFPFFRQHLVTTEFLALLRFFNTIDKNNFEKILIFLLEI